MNAAAINPHAGVKAGKHRKPWRIKEWMSGKGLEQKHVAEKAEISAVSIVSRTINGGANNRKVLAALKDLGCPEKYLALPEDMKGEQ